MTTEAVAFHRISAQRYPGLSGWCIRLTAAVVLRFLAVFACAIFSESVGLKLISIVEGVGGPWYSLTVKSRK